MRVAHNISAINTLNALNKNSKLSDKSVGKLFSGLRINKAADDAAGLSISEKMRGQIRGLAQAERNTRDGISLIQTAESGMQEITNILQRQRELIVQGLSDTATNEDRKKIDEEIHALTNEIDSISTKTEFNTMNLLGRNNYQILEDRSSSNVAVTISDPPATSSTSINVEYKPRGTAEQPRQLISDTDTSVTTDTYSNSNNVTPISLPDGRSGYNEYEVDIHTSTQIDTNTKVFESLLASDDPKYTTPAYWYSAGMNDTVFGPKNFGNVYGRMFENMEVNGATTGVEYTASSGVGSVPAVDYMRFPNTNVTITRYRTVLADNSMEIKYVINNTDSSDSNIKLSNKIDPPVNSVIMDVDGNPLPVGTNNINSPSGNTFSMAGRDANAGLIFDDAFGFTSPTALTINNPASGQPQIDFEWDMTIPQGTSITIGFKYGPFSLNLDVFERTRETEVTKHVETTVTTNIKDIDFISPKLDIQTGANSGQTISIPLFTVDAKALGVANLGLLPPSVPEQALAKTDGAVAKVSHFRGIYGALQNRMEHSLNNVGNSLENLTAAESRIRDADIAKEMLNYTKSNILTQAAQAMLAQSNQNSQAVLQLLK